MDILVTGGNGFIGSHTCLALSEKFPNARLVIVDNLTNSTMKVLENLKKIIKTEVDFYDFDVCDEKKLSSIFDKYNFEGVIHFAGYKAVGESVAIPLKYYSNNINSTISLVNCCLKYNVNKFVFSSSATVYGDNQSPLNENMKLLPTSNPYGETKAICERILMDVANVNTKFAVTLLRYFNPIGAHESGLIGESPNGIPNNLMPYVTKVAKGDLPKLNVFGGDYPTIDGTGVRDFIHVMDLAEGHVAALEHIQAGIHIFNLGTGKGTSVLELINTFEKVNDIKIPYTITDRRSGDLAEIYADVEKAEVELNWTARYSIEDMCRDAWRFESKLVNI